MMRQLSHIAACAALVLFATTAAHAKEVRIDSRIAGATNYTPNPATGGGVADLVAMGKGAPGKSSFRSATEYGPPGPPSARCDGFDFELVAVGGSTVATFEDLSQLYGVTTSGYVCGSLDGARMSVSEGTIVGGTGRFEGATGTATFTSQGLALTPAVGLISSVTGTITGTASIDN
jgi:hypothetical protein